MATRYVRSTLAILVVAGCVSPRDDRPAPDAMDFAGADGGITGADTGGAIAGADGGIAGDVARLPDASPDGVGARLPEASAAPGAGTALDAPVESGALPDTEADGQACTDSKCACPPAPAECGGRAGHWCTPIGKLGQCLLDPVSGCLQIGPAEDCTGGRACRGPAPEASCACVTAMGAACGSCGGTVQCDGSCSQSTPANYGQACGRCGGTIQCDGQCSPDPAGLGGPCSVGSAGVCRRNGHLACVNGTAQLACDATAGVPVDAFSDRPSPDPLVDVSQNTGTYDARFDWNCDGVTEQDWGHCEAHGAAECTPNTNATGVMGGFCVAERDVGGCPQLPARCGDQVFVYPCFFNVTEGICRAGGITSTATMKCR